MSEQITMPLSVALLLDNMFNVLLKKKVKQDDGTEVLEEREIPFRLRYRLARNLVPLDKDLKEFENYKYLLVAKYGEPTEDGKNVVIKDPAKFEAYKNEIMAVLDGEVTHNVLKLDPADFESLKDPDIDFSTDAVKVLVSYLVEDEEFDAEMAKSCINYSVRQVAEEKKEDLVETKTVEEATPVIEPTNTEAIVAESAAPVKKVATKKTTTAKKAPTAKKTTKKTTTKKTTKKEA